MTDTDVLDRFLAGEDVEASPEVRELAQLAAVLQGAWGQAPTAASTVRARTAMLSAFEAGDGGATTVPLALVRRSPGRRLLTRLALAAALVVGIPATALAASSDALPGELLYPVKLGFEQVRLALAGDPVDEARALLDFAEERVEETVLANALGRDAAVTEALRGYEEAVAGFEGRVLEATSLGLPVGDLDASGQAAFAEYEELFETILGSPPTESIEDPSIVPPAGEPSNPGKAGNGGSGTGKQGGGHKSHGQGRNAGSTGSANSGGNGGSAGNGGNGNNGGNHGGNNGGGNGGGGAGGGQGDGGGVTEATPAVGESNGNCGNGNGSGAAAGAGQGNGNGNSCTDVGTGVDDSEKGDPSRHDNKAHEEKADEEVGL